MTICCGKFIAYAMTYDLPIPAPFSEAKVIAHAPSRFKTSISFSHSFGVTAKFFVQLEQPLTMSLSDLMLMQTRNRNVADCFHDNKGETVSWGMVKAGGITRQSL